MRQKCILHIITRIRNVFYFISFGINTYSIIGDVGCVTGTFKDLLATTSF